MNIYHSNGLSNALWAFFGPELPLFDQKNDTFAFRPLFISLLTL